MHTTPVDGFFTRITGDENFRFEFDHPARLDQMVHHGLDQQIVFDRDKDDKLIPIGETPEEWVNGKQTQARDVIFKTKTLPGFLYGYAVALLVGSDSRNACIVQAALEFKLAGHAREPFITGVFQTADSNPDEADLYTGFYRRAETVIGNMHGFMGKRDGPSKYCRSAVIFVDIDHLEVAERAFTTAFAQDGKARDKMYHLVGVRIRTETFENEMAS